MGFVVADGKFLLPSARLTAGYSQMTQIVFHGKLYESLRELVDDFYDANALEKKKGIKQVAGSIRRWKSRHQGQPIPDDVILNALTAGSWGREIEFKGRVYKSVRHLTTEWNARGGCDAPVDSNNVGNNLRNWRTKNPGRPLDDSVILLALTPRGVRNGICYKGVTYSGPTTLFRALSGITNATFKLFFSNLSAWKKSNSGKPLDDHVIESLARRRRSETVEGKYVSALRAAWMILPAPKLSWSGTQRSIARFKKLEKRDPKPSEIPALAQFDDWLPADKNDLFFRWPDGRIKTHNELYDSIDGEKCDVSAFSSRLRKHRRRTGEIPNESVVRALAKSWGVVDRVAGILYRWRHLESGRIYIGMTTETLDERIRGHLRETIEGKLRKGGLHEVIAKDGVNAFEITELGRFSSIEDLQSAERAAITRYDSLAPNGFNLDSGGKGVTARMLPLSVRGKNYKNLTALAAEFRIPVKRLESRLRIGWSLDEAIDRKGKAFYRKSNPHGLPEDVSIPRLAREHGVDARLVYNRLHAGWSLEEALDRSKRSFRHARARSITVNGEIFRSTEAAAKHFGVSIAAWRKRVLLGWTMEQVAGLNAPPARRAKRKNGYR